MEIEYQTPSPLPTKPMIIILWFSAVFPFLSSIITMLWWNVTDRSEDDRNGFNEHLQEPEKKLSKGPWQLPAYTDSHGCHIISKGVNNEVLNTAHPG